MSSIELQQRLESIYAVAALAPLVEALYGANATNALDTVTTTIRETLTPMLTITTEGNGATIAPPPTKESELDVVITLNGQRATGKTMLAGRITQALREQGFDVVENITDGTVEVLRVLDPAKAFRVTATDTPICDCPRCRGERGETLSAGEQKAVEGMKQLDDLFARIFGEK